MGILGHWGNGQWVERRAIVAWTIINAGRRFRAPNAAKKISVWLVVVVHISLGSSTRQVLVARVGI